MKWTVSQLKKKHHQNNQFEATVDLSKFIDDNGDIISVDPTHVQGIIDVEDDRYYHFDLTIHTTLWMACAQTLEPVRVPLVIEVTETFTHDAHDDYRTIEGITIDLLPIIWSNIYLEKPMRVTHPKASSSFDDYQVEKEPSVNPHFEALKKFKS